MFFSVPSDPDKRMVWIAAIEKHQEFNYHISKFYVCESHFRKDDIYKNRKRTTLLPNVTPTIFPNETDNVEVEFLDEDSSFFESNVHFLKANFTEDQNRNIDKDDVNQCTDATDFSKEYFKQHHENMLVYNFL